MKLVRVAAVALLVLLAGTVADFRAGFKTEFGLARFNVDGRLDAGFGGGGEVLTSLGAVNVQSVAGVALEPGTNAIVVAGTAQDPSTFAGEFALARYMSGDGGLDASFAVTNAWNNGFQGAVTVHNEGAATVSGWEFELKISNEITQIWNAEIVSRTSSGYIIHNAAWNGGIAGDGEISFGFLASGQANPAQVDFVF